MGGGQLLEKGALLGIGAHLGEGERGHLYWRKYSTCTSLYTEKLILKNKDL